MFQQQARAHRLSGANNSEPQPSQLLLRLWAESPVLEVTRFDSVSQLPWHLGWSRSWALHPVSYLVAAKKMVLPLQFQVWIAGVCKDNGRLGMVVPRNSWSLDSFRPPWAIEGRYSLKTRERRRNKGGKRDGEGGRRKMGDNRFLCIASSPLNSLLSFFSFVKNEFFSHTIYLNYSFSSLPFSLPSSPSLPLFLPVPLLWPSPFRIHSFSVSN